MSNSWSKGILALFLASFLAVASFSTARIGRAATTGHASGAHHALVTITINNYAFVPKTKTIALGDTVKWINKDPTSHTVTADSKSRTQFASSPLNKGATFRVTFNKTGTFHYHCNFHAFMAGTIVVRGHR